ncbi:tRNA 2-selenouridine(34) synthase MnmH [Aquibacillus albus]|uniref:tRNA 2-selenouridine synthase n=1 Tax=Aquibacillus albus TaxID=1168171 RepID=A0ABS2N052_9BACI|nr:tRNA 2-selenouridine(34) synthase MnmH [Aquibacillus albus]MBM7571471.1 tRNA 2-selenouridine synthase [Aquibacillus albus]
MFRDIKLAQLQDLQQNQTIALIDVRSPSEYNHSTIPGSINIPVFSDEERAEVGSLYKQVSAEAAKERGLEIMSKKLPAFIKAFRDIPNPKVVYCWRGGMRSKTAATLVDLIGIPVYRLDGGFRSYRQWVVDTLETIDFQADAFLLNGYTGTGKTIMLQKLKEESYPVVDLEGMANHRGSIFGQIGLNPHNQTTFDSLLLERLLPLIDSPYVLFEAESKRIGKVMLPDFLRKTKEEGLQIFVEMPIEERIKNILDEYEPWNYHEECLHAYGLIKKRIHTPVAKEIENDLHNQNYSSAVHQLLEYYYDPLYDYTRKQYPTNQSITIKADDVDDGVQKVKEVLESVHVM